MGDARIGDIRWETRESPESLPGPLRVGRAVIPAHPLPSDKALPRTALCALATALFPDCSHRERTALYTGQGRLTRLSAGPARRRRCYSRLPPTDS